MTVLVQLCECAALLSASFTMWCVGMWLLSKTHSDLTTPRTGSGAK